LADFGVIQTDILPSLSPWQGGQRGSWVPAAQFCSKSQRYLYIHTMQLTNAFSKQY